MKSIKLISKGEFAIMDEAIPSLDEKNNVLIKITSVGICGSDMHYFKNGKVGKQVVKFPCIIGHEASGYIEKVGGGVKDLHIGQLVSIEPAMHCGECDQCRNGRPHTCRNIRFMGAPGQMDGLMREYVALPQENIFAVPDDFTINEAAFVEPMAIGAYAVKLSRLSKNEKVGIIGVGPIGLSVLLSLKFWGNQAVYVWDKLDYRLDIAKNTGAVWTANLDKVQIEKELLETVTEGLDVVIECCGKQDALDTALNVIKPGGKLVIVGIPTEERISFDVSALRRKEVEIINVRRQNHSVMDAIKIVDHYKPLDDYLITHSYNYDQASEAFKMVEAYSDKVIKAVIQF